MKKHLKTWLTVLAASTLSLGTLAPVANAQEVNWDQVLTEINTANQEIVSMEGDGSIAIAAEGYLNLNASTAFRFNTEDRFALDLTGDVTGELTAGNGSDNETSMPLDFSGKATVVDGIAYFFDGSSWTVQDITAQEDEIAKQVSDILAQAQAQAASTDSVALTQKYFDLSENDTDYVMTLKSDINPEEFWADVEASVDMDALVQQSVDEAVAQAEAAGEPLTEEEQAQVRQEFTDSFEVSKKIVFKFIEKLEMHYSKENYYLTHLSMSLNVSSTDIQEMLSVSGDTAGAVPDDLNVTAEIVFNFTNHGQVFDIVAPADAPAPTADESGESSDSAADESGEEVSDEESATEESSAAETTEETTDEASESDSATESTVEESSAE